MFQDPTFWVLVAFVGFVALIIYFKVPGMITSALDARAKKIKADLDEADSLLKEAQDLLALYQKKQRETANEKTVEKSVKIEPYLRAWTPGHLDTPENLHGREPSVFLKNSKV